jgi:RNA polymerase sigma-70 factor (ECF subfamily)
VDTRPAAQAVEALIHEYYTLVFHTIYGLTGDWEESQDLTQDTFHQALKAIDAARTASGVQFRAKAWLLRIALNTVRMQQRRRNIFRFIPFSRMQGEQKEKAYDAEIDTLNAQAAAVQPAGFGATNTNNDDPAVLVAERDAVQRTMARLPEALRACLLLSVVGRFSSAEIAEILDIHEAAVRQRLVRARKQFQQFYVLESGEEISDSNDPHAAEKSTFDGNKQQNNVTFLNSHASLLS